MNTKTFLLAVLTILFTCAIASAQVEEITLSTYYPAPFGEYDELAADRLIVNTQMIDPLSEEFNDMQQGDCHIGWSLIVGHGGTGFSYDELNTAGNLPGDGDVIIKGKVGIGTSTPPGNHRLLINGPTKIQGKLALLAPGFDVTSNQPGIVFGKAFGTQKANYYSGFHRLGAGMGGSYTLFTSGMSNVMTLTDTGNVGIGTTGPGAKLHINANGNTEYYLAMTDTQTGGNTWRFYGGAGSGAGTDSLGLYDTDGSAYRMVWKNNGYVGIGTTDPQAKLHVGGTAGTDGIMFPDGTLQTTAAGKAPCYGVIYDQTTTLYSIANFTSPEAIFSIPSLGALMFPHYNLDGSYLLQMTVNVTEATTKTLYLGAVDNRIDFFMDGGHVAGPWGVGAHRTNVNFNLSVGEHTIQIIYNSQGGPDYLYLYGNIVDNEKVFYKG